MRLCLWILALLIPVCVHAQSREVLPNQLALKVRVEASDHLPYPREMVLISIEGIYRRHITREKLIQPDFDGFSWTQLGNDTWREERLNGEKVKTLKRRMAIYPDRAGTLTIGAFTHQLTLTDEGDDWFDHAITSAPVTIEVAPPPPALDTDWWFPVRSLKISDDWSNAPDQLVPGEGVLRIVRIEALGVTPEMIPPMPDLQSPSAMIFPHPEKRFVELSPDGPLSYAFWRWTIRPGNDTSTIVEPLSFDYFDTATRDPRTVTISAQRVAYGSVTPSPVAPAERPPSARLPGWPLAVLAGLVFLGGVALAMAGKRMVGARALHRFALFDPLARALHRAVRQGDLAATRRAAGAILRRDGNAPARLLILAQLDRDVFDPKAKTGDLRDFAQAFLANRTAVV
ncbi:MAG: hypothetical protein AB8B51_04550 [Sedimentitalea sp.]